MRLPPSNREGPAPRLGTLRTDGTAATSGKAKLDFDDLLVACPGGCPTARCLPLRTAGLFVFPANRKISQGIAIVLSCLPPIVFGAGAYQIDLIGFRSLDQRFGIRVSSIH